MYSEHYIKSCGKGKIHISKWVPDAKEPVGVLQIVHGIAEHTERYDYFARFLNELGYIVVADDHMGHGKSVFKDDVFGYFTGGWNCAVADTYQVLLNTQTEYPTLPYVILGHSMGSFMTRTILIQHPECKLAGAIICGTGWMPETVIKTGVVAAKLVCKVHGERKQTSLIQALSFAGYNKMVENKRTSFDWLCRDPKVVDAYIADPLCGFTATAGLFRDMFGGMLFNQNPDNLAKMNRDLPVHFISGDCDPVGSYGKGVMKAVSAFRNSGMKHVTVKLYPMGRHEILNEINKNEVYKDVAEKIKVFVSQCY